MEKITGEFEIELPAQQKLDDYLDLILPQIRQYSEDLREMENYVMAGGKPWQEIRDDVSFQEVVLHFFNDGGEYLQSVDGNVSKGRWRLLDTTNKIIIESGGGKFNTSELYELAFLDQNFFILKKHGDQQRKRSRQYLMMGYEGAVRGLKWKDAVELLFNQYKGQMGSFNYFVIAAIVLVLIVILFSLL